MKDVRIAETDRLRRVTGIVVTVLLLAGAVAFFVRDTSRPALLSPEVVGWLTAAVLVLAVSALVLARLEQLRDPRRKAEPRHVRAEAPTLAEVARLRRGSRLLDRFTGEELQEVIALLNRYNLERERRSRRASLAVTIATLLIGAVLPDLIHVTTRAVTGWLSH